MIGSRVQYQINLAASCRSSRYCFSQDAYELLTSMVIRELLTSVPRFAK